MIGEKKIELIKKVHELDGCGYHVAKNIVDMVLAELEPCEDVVSRQAVLEALNCEISGSIESDIDLSKYKREFQEFANIVFNAQKKAIQALPPTPTRKKGKWIQQIEEDADGELLSYWECSKCGRIVGHNMADIKDVINDYPFCHCGAEMESEDDSN